MKSWIASLALGGWLATRAATAADSYTVDDFAMVDKIDIANDADVVKMNIVLSNQKLQALITQFGALSGLGGLGAK